MRLCILLFSMSLVSASIYADDSSTLDAAVGGGIGGAIGAAVGNEVGGKDGAMIGGAVGAAAGVAVNTDEEGHGHEHHRRDVYDDHRRGHFCPPGQAKKGNC